MAKPTAQPAPPMPALPNREAAEPTVLDVLQRHLVVPLSQDPNVRAIRAQRGADGWQVYVLIDRWTLDSTRPLARQLAALHEVMEREVPSAILNDHVWEWDPADDTLQEPGSHVLYNREAA